MHLSPPLVTAFWKWDWSRIFMSSKCLYEHFFFSYLNNQSWGERKKNITMESHLLFPKFSPMYVSWVILSPLAVTLLGRYQESRILTQWKHPCSKPEYIRWLWSISRASMVAQMVKNLPAYRRPGFDPWVRKIPWRMEWHPTPVFCLESSMV